MKPPTKILLMNRLNEKMQLKPGQKGFKEALEIYNELYRVTKKEQTNTLMGIRLIYSILFLIIMLYGIFHIKQYVFIILMGLIMLYNFLAFLSQYVFFYNNFRNSGKRV